MHEIIVKTYPWEWEFKSSRSINGAVQDYSFLGSVLLEVPQDDLNQLNLLTEYSCIGRKYYKNHRWYMLVAMPYSEHNSSIENNLCIEWAKIRFKNFHYLGDQNFSEELKECLKSWIGFFDYLAYKSDPNNVNVKFEHELFRYDDLPEIIVKMVQEDEEIYKPLIVTISNEFTKFLPLVLSGIRKTLKREDRLQKLDKVNEVNVNSLRWLVKQPGKSIFQKAAANDSKILAVVRTENYDLLENQVLKDFLRRCILACTNFLKENHKSSNEDLVKHFEQQCIDGLHRAEFTYVRRPAAAIVPNYVLQNDLRYRKVWQYYQDLLRHNRRVDNLLHWLYITSSDLSCLLMASALYVLPNENSSNPNFTLELIATSNLKIRKENRQGVLLDHSLPPGSFYLCGSSGREYVIDFISDVNSIPITSRQDDLYNTAAQTASILGTKSCILCTPLNEDDKPYLILLYSLNNALSTHEDNAEVASQILKSSESCINDYELLELQEWHLLSLTFNYELKVTPSAFNEEKEHALLCHVPMQIGQWRNVSEQVQMAVTSLLNRVVQNG